MWSGGDYSNTVPGFNYARTELSISDEWCSQGNISIKGVNAPEENGGYFFMTLSAEELDTYVFTCKLNNQGETGNVTLLALDSQNQSSNLQVVSVPTNTVSNIELTGDIPEGYSKVRFSFPCIHGAVYVDDLYLKKV